MSTAATIEPATEPAAHGAGQPADREQLRHVIEHVAHLLPAQGPITVFIHHNTLHAFEEHHFEEALRRASRVYGCQPYLTEARYRAALARGRIRADELDDVLREDLGNGADHPVPPNCTRFDLRRAMLQHPVQTAPAVELRWFVAQTESLRRMRPEASLEARNRVIFDTRQWILRDVRGQKEEESGRPRRTSLQQRFHDLFERFGEESIDQWSDPVWETFTLNALWRACRDGVHGVKAFTPPPPPAVRHRDLLLEATAEDCDRPVNEFLIRFCAAFLDQGFSHWSLPHRSAGFLEAFCRLYGQAGGPPEGFLRDARPELARHAGGETSALESVHESLEALGVPAPEWDVYLSATLLALRGWAGMIQQIADRGDRVALPIPDDSLTEFLAVRLILERYALVRAARESIGFDGPLHELRGILRKCIQKHQTPGVDQRAFVVFQLAQVLGWAPRQLDELSKRQWSALIEEIESFSGLERRRLFHRAYERRYLAQTLDAISAHCRKGTQAPASPRFQAIFCIDDREESFRRHIEELAPESETFAAAGFFAFPIYYKGAADAHFIPLCPVVIRPKHWVTETVAETHEGQHRQRAGLRRVLGRIGHWLHLGSRTFTGGTLVSAGFGVFASVPLISRILFPRLAANVRRKAARLVEPPSLTQLALERTEATPGPEPGHLGFSVAEMADSAERLLRDIGMTSGFSRLVLIVGHGSTSVNNPHMSAYGCGACSGAAGGPNARGMAQVLNDFRVRELLARRGLHIPNDTVFVGGLHNTCKEAVTFFDVDRVPQSHRREWEEVRDVIENACDRNAHERCRRFESAPLSLEPVDARRHVEARSEDLAQTRPELGHVTNAVIVVGRRSRTRGLFMDRRSFLTCYDPTQDDANATILTRTLGAVIPVCSGISLEYYFSHVDSMGFGCGTKLPHNVSALLGVMDGAASDLRTGLPWQMVEIHEAVRILFLIEATPETVLGVLERNPNLGQFCRNGWIQLAVLSPTSPEIQVYKDGVFTPYEPTPGELPQVRSSREWYQNQRDHLGYAEISP